VATLHVRNVPDDLYDRLRKQAEADGRSIGAETVQLLDQHLGGGGRRGLRRRRGPSGRQRMGASGRAVIAAAQEEARGLGHAHIGTEHLLLGVLAQGPLGGLTLEQARDGLERIVGRGDHAPEGQIPFTPRAKEVLELALREAQPATVEPEDIALAILREGEGPGFELLSASAPDLDAALVAGPDLPRFRVLELEGAAADWEASLNDAAAAGYELASIVDRRAVLHLRA